MIPEPSERFEISLNTSAGQITTAVDVPTGFVPVTSIVPLMRRLGEETQALEITRLAETGSVPTCQKGCAACCRMLVPLSAPEAFAVRDWVRSRPAEQQAQIIARLAETKVRLLSHGIWQRLSELCETADQPGDDVLDEINRRYYALRLACPFLDEEVCTIYDERPAACRELLVTSPADRCEDLIVNPVDTIPTPLRMSTVLGLLWQDLTGTSTRLIPLPVALDWAENHVRSSEQEWKGTQLFDQALDKVWRFLSQSCSGDRGASGS
ncbi:MAG: YkgJ family cysteine cluster protein [Nitrospira sp.]|nr:YkgJ family cysteine cluster protein [Nitrospira sp.]MDH4304008.1 YkgJ family cysteine cluster protein [Nitrospira sp.]